MRLWRRVPVTIAVGPSNTGKSLLARVAASLLGVHRTGVYKKISEAEEIMHCSVYFVLNDPENSKPVKDLTMKVNMAYIFYKSSMDILCNNELTDFIL